MGEQSEDPLAFRLLNEIGIIDQLASATLEQRLPDGLRLSQFLLLNHLVRLGGDWSPARLADAFQVTRAAMTNTVNRLESRELVQAVADPEDGRGKLIRLTPSGRAMRRRCIRSLQPVLDDLEEQFGRQRIREVLPLLLDIRNYLDRARG